MLRQKIQDDIKSALKSGEKEKLLSLRHFWSTIKNKEIDLKHELDDAEVAVVANALVKQRRDSIDQYEKGGRTELVEKEKKELEILLSYMPQQLTEDEIKKLVEDAVAETGAAGPADMGSVMKALMSKTRGKADGKVVSDLVRNRLTGG